jgi:glycosyltransferase involved in cell wall biosynthesis
MSTEKPIAIIIPALNEEKSIGLVLKDIPKELVREVVLVDNGSTDKTAEIARNAGAVVLKEPIKGYGRACLTGLSYLSANPPEIVCFLDGDYSDHPDQLLDVVGPILDGEADMVIGSRSLGGAEQGALLPQARYGNALACFLIKQLYGVQYSDLGPFRAISWSALEKIGMIDQNFGWTVEMQVKAARLNLRIKEVSVRYRKRVGVSKITGTLSGTFRAGYKILYTIAKYARS